MSSVNSFFGRVEYSDYCWEWTGFVGTNGYGQFSHKGETFRAHRWSYEYFIEPLGSMYCCHHCDNRKCVNPFHLFKGTHSDNMRDCVDKGRHHLSKKNYCKLGHPLYGTNLKVYIRNGRERRKCLICKRLSGRRSDSKRFGYNFYGHGVSDE